MIEIVFNDSACGTLKMAQRYGTGDYISGCVSVTLIKNDGSQPTPDELSAAKKTAEEQNRLEWEKAIPMGGNPQDVFGFNLILSVGDISDDDFANRRQKTIDTLWSIYSNDPSDGLLDIASELQKTLIMIHKRVVQGEDIRIWYSNNPDEMCGLYWFMSELQQFEAQLGAVYIVKLPEHEYRDNNTVVCSLSWGEISPGEWYRYTNFSEATTSVFRQYCASEWRTLQKENAPLRAVLNGQLHSVSETIYDAFISREIDAQDDEFQEAIVIGNVLGKYQLGIGGAWVAHRIEKMIDEGKLSVISTPIKNGPIYHRQLRKNPTN